MTFAASPWTVSSPDGTITISITQNADGSLNYSVAKSGTPVLEASTLGINTGLADFKTGLTFSDSSTNTINESYSVTTGKKSAYTNNCNELSLNFTKNNQQMSVVLRAYNDGIAYRYYFPTATNVVTEYSQFNLPEGNCWIMDQDNSYEKEYSSKTIATASAGTETYSMCPAFQLSNGYYLWLGEAAVYSDYCNSNLQGSGTGDGTFNVVNVSGEATSSSTNISPWRVAVIGGLNTLIETTIVENLNPASEITDTSWINTGGCAWEWLNGDSTSSLDVAKQYIDFAASMGWKYYIADEGWADSWAPEMCAYGNSKGVGVILWAHHNTLTTQAAVDTLLTKWAGWGAKGIKVDFFDGERQLENQERDRITQKAASLHMIVNYHGTTEPTGTSRRWPNLVAYEAVKGNENNPSDTNYAILPFTRGVAGPADITSVMTWSTGTAGYETATALTLLDGYQCYCSKPGQYNYYLTKEFLKVLPSTFDETRFIEGSIGNYITVARRKGNDWYIGGTTVTARTASVPLSFLGSGSYVATIYDDNTYSTQNVTSATTLSLPCGAKGGFVIRISTSALPAPAVHPNVYEAEDGNLLGGASVLSSSQASGGYKVGNIGGTATNGICTISNVNAATAGSKTLTVYYLSAVDRTFYVTVNNGGYVALNCTGSGSWNTVSTATMTVNLNAGDNTIKFDNGAGAYAPDLDKITITDVNVYEAENGTLSGGAAVMASSQASTGYKVGDIGGTSSNGICTINNVYAATSGSKTMTVSYLSAVDRTFYVTVNNGAYVALDCTGSGSWNTVSTVTMTVNLNAGNNTIKFDNGAGAFAPDLDKIEVN